MKSTDIPGYGKMLGTANTPEEARTLIGRCKAQGIKVRVEPFKAIVHQKSGDRATDWTAQPGFTIMES